MWYRCESSQVRARGKLGIISTSPSFQVLLNLRKFHKNFTASLEFCLLYLDLSYDPEKLLKHTDMLELDSKPPFKIIEKGVHLDAFSSTLRQKHGNCYILMQRIIQIFNKAKWLPG